MGDNLVESNIPNGGYGWIIVAAVALINMFNQSIISVFGLLFSSHLEDMGHGTTGAALITNLNCLALNFSGLFIGPAIKSFSPRLVACTGCILTSFGLMMCSLSTKLWHIIICYSVMVGLGLGLIAPSTFMAINSYFTTKRGRAVGISLAGTGVGQMIIPHIVRILLDNYGFHTTILIMGALALNGLIGACLFRPVEVNKQIKKQGKMKEANLLLNTQTDKNNCTNFEVKSKELEIISTETKHSEINKLWKKMFKTISQAMDLELLKDPTFWSVIIGMGLVYTASTNFSMLFPYFLQFSVGMSRHDTANCMSALAGADILCRLLLPFLTDKLKWPYRVIFLLGGIGLLTARAVLAEALDFYTLIVMSILYGCSKSATIVNNNLTISSHCKSENLAGGLGLNMICRGLMVISLGQLLGWIRDYSRSYSLCLHVQNLLIFIVIIIWIPEIMYKYIKNFRNRKREARDII